MSLEDDLPTEEVGPLILIALPTSEVPPARPSSAAPRPASLRLLAQSSSLVLGAGGSLYGLFGLSIMVAGLWIALVPWSAGDVHSGIGLAVASTVVVVAPAGVAVSAALLVLLLTSRAPARRPFVS